MDERTGEILSVPDRLLEHIHQIPDELEKETVEFVKWAKARRVTPAARMTGDGMLSQFRLDLARHRRNKKAKARQRRKARR